MQPERSAIEEAAHGVTDPSSARDHAGTVRAMFSAIAPTYDRLNRVLSFSIDRRWRRRTAQEVLGSMRRRSESASRALDICSGTGDLAEAFRRASSGTTEVFEADFSHEMLLLASRKRRGAGGRLEADALRLPFRDDAFDAAAMAFGLRNLSDRAAGIREMARCVRKGGEVAVLEFGRPRAWWLRGCYRIYLHGWLPLLGGMMSGSAAYGYLARTVEGFAEPETVCRWMREAGMSQVEARHLTGGIAVLYKGVVQ